MVLFEAIGGMLAGKMKFNEAISQITKLFASGDLVQEGNTLLGLASNGQVVTIENDMSRPAAARDVICYIMEHPTPSDW